MSRRSASAFALTVATVVIVVAFGVSWHYFGRMNPYESLMPGSQSTVDPPIQLSDVEVRNRLSGVSQWQVRAAALTISSDRRSVTADGLSDGVFYRSGAPIVGFNAHHVAYSLPQFYSKAAITIDGGVNLWTNRKLSPTGTPLRVSTAGLNWDGATSVARCDGPVSFSVGSLGQGTADGLVYDAPRRIVRFSDIRLAADTTAAQQPSPSPPSTPNSAQATTADADSNLVTYAATQSGYWDENNRVLTLVGEVTFHQGKAEVQMNGASYDRKTNVATSSSPVTITDTDTTVTGDHGAIDFTTHIADLSGHITMKILPKPEDKVREEETKKPTTILCNQINYDYRAKQAHTAGAVLIEQPGRTVTADDGHYDVALKVVTLTGDVVGKSTDGKIIKAPNAKVSVDPNDEWIDLVGPVTGQLPVSDADNPLADDTKAKPKGAGSSAQSVSPSAAPAAPSQGPDTNPVH